MKDMKRKLKDQNFIYDNNNMMTTAMRNVVFNYNNDNNINNKYDDEKNKRQGKEEQLVDDNNAIRGIIMMGMESDEAEARADGIGIVAGIERLSYNIETTVTTVPKHQQQIIKNKRLSPLSTSISSSSSLLKSSPTALAKFNRIIDTTMSDTNFYQIKQHNIVSIDSSITSTTTATTTTTTTNTTLDNEHKYRREVVDKDDNQIKRNDVHYLLKQLNSFSDIEEIEIVDMQEQQQYNGMQATDTSTTNTINTNTTNSTTTNITTATTSIRNNNVTKSKNQIELYSPTAKSLVLKSPSSLSHKGGIRRYASLHQTHETLPPTMVVSSQSQQLPPTQGTTAAATTTLSSQYVTTGSGIGGRVAAATTTAAAGVVEDGGRSLATAAHLLQQFDDYLFQSCHYLETNYFAANYRTAMVESSSHEFRPSTTTGTSASYSSHSSIHTFDLHETEPPSVICKAQPPLQLLQTSPTIASLPLSLSPTVVAPLSPCQLSVAMFTMSHELKDQQQQQQHHYYYQQQQPQYTYAIHAQQPPVLAPPPRRFQMQTRLTSSGVQTELTASSLSTAATNTSSLAKSFTSVASAASHPTSTSSSSSTEATRCRRKPLFKCCYTPIDRWRERRTAAATHKQQRAGSHAGLDATNKNIKTRTNSSAV